MTDDEQTLLLIKGSIASLTEAEQQIVRETAERLRATISVAGQREPSAGLIALALVGAEAQLGQLQG
jgi:hypothetical protein